MRQLKYPLIVILMAVIVYVAFYVKCNAEAQAKSAGVTSDIGHVRYELLLFHNDHDAYPASLAELKLDPHYEKDWVSGKPLLYFPGGRSGVLLAQPEPFRTGLWPFGESRQYGIFMEGDGLSIQDVYATLHSNTPPGTLESALLDDFFSRDLNN